MNLRTVTIPRDGARAEAASYARAARHESDPGRRAPNPGRCRVNVLSLFAGIGGLDLGLERAGMTVVGQVELDPFCRRVLAAHWPEVPRHDDVRTAPAWWLGSARPPVDVVAGGPPCQPVSQAGAKRGQEDERWLWPAWADVIAAVRPRWVIAENPPGLLRLGFADVLRDLSALGFDAEWDCIPAAAVGAPQLRDRVFVVAYLREPSGGVPDPDGERVRLERERSRQQHGEPRPAVAAHDGPAQPVADTDRTYRRRPAADAWPGDCRPTMGGGEAESGRRDRDVADAASKPRPEPPGGRDCLRRPLRAEPERRCDALAGRRVFVGAPDVTDWPAEPRIRRVANGIPHQVDRLRSLGNAVVPQVAEHIGRLVMEAAA